MILMKMIEWVGYYATQIYNICPTLSLLNHGDVIYPCEVCGSSNWVSQEPPSLKEPCYILDLVGQLVERKHYFGNCYTANPDIRIDLTYPTVFCNSLQKCCHLLSQW